ncbi:MAG TPA: hypothetical protein VFH27_07330, partial [Longimicrobiaceae bacterium]|nr:hypothetical protein [Longimicrobiaceae bacterium]
MSTHPLHPARPRARPAPYFAPEATPAYVPVDAPPAARQPRSTRWVQGFIIFQLLCQLGLIVGGLGGARLVFRIASFASSLILLAVLHGRGSRHPGARAGAFAVAVIGAQMLNPMTVSGLAGLAQFVLLTAVIAPLFWVPRLQIDGRALRQVAMILWGFHTLSASLGVLQVYKPGRFQPPISTVVMSKGKGYVESLKLVTSSGERVFRPMGLTDMPGGAAISGLYSVLF